MRDLWLKGDAAGTLERLYPPWVEKFGREAVRRWIERSDAAHLEKARLKVLSTTTLNVRACAEVRGQLQCVVEGEEVMQSWTARWISVETQTVAFSEDRGKTWHFVPFEFGEKAELQAARARLPELSPDLPLRAVRPWIMTP